jgi:hypothetical protein
MPPVKAWPFFKELVMQQRFRKLALFVGAATLAAGGLVMAACSTDNGGTVQTPAFDGGGVTKEGGGGGLPEAGPQPDGGGGVDGGGGDAAADCGTPAKLFPPTADGGIFCPFSGPPGGKNVSCLDTEQCCENAKGAGVSTCAPKGSVCPVAGATVWECEDPSSCPTGQKCCAHSSAAGTPVTVGNDTCGPFLSKFSGTKCAAACATGELVVCEQQSECTTGTCTAVKPKGNSIGVCN